MSFREVSCKEFTINPFTSLSTDAVLITAPDGDSVNPMTAAWGSYGYIWNKNAITVVVRPQRYTFGLMENTDTYTVAYFHNKRRDAMSLCGTQSGRDIDKMKEKNRRNTRKERILLPRKEPAATFRICRRSPAPIPWATRMAVPPHMAVMADNTI